MFITHPDQSIEDVDTQNDLLSVPSSEFEGYADPAELDRHSKQLQESCENNYYYGDWNINGDVVMVLLWW